MQNEKASNVLFLHYDKTSNALAMVDRMKDFGFLPTLCKNIAWRIFVAFNVSLVKNFHMKKPLDHPLA